MKCAPDIGIGFKLDKVNFIRKIDISLATVNRKTRNELNLNSTRIRFDVKK